MGEYYKDYLGIRTIYGVYKVLGLGVLSRGPSYSPVILYGRAGDITSCTWRAQLTIVLLSGSRFYRVEVYTNYYQTGSPGSSVFGYRLSSAQGAMAKQPKRNSVRALATNPRGLLNT